jgi:hypothetical protein
MSANAPRIAIVAIGLRGSVPEGADVDSEIQLISDSDGLAVIGEPAAVELFLESEGLPSRELGCPA